MKSPNTLQAFKHEQPVSLQYEPNFKGPLYTPKLYTKGLAKNIVTIIDEAQFPMRRPMNTTFYKKASVDDALPFRESRSSLPNITD